MENYYELTVDKEATKKDKLNIVLVWTGCILACIAMFILGAHFMAFPVALIGAAMFVLIALLFQKRTHAEFEYIFNEDHMTVDKIVKKVRRVSLTGIDFSDIMDFGVYEKSIKAKYKPYYTYNHAIHKDKQHWYCYYYINKRKCLLVFEPDETMLGLIRDALPAKIKSYAFGGN